MDDCSGEFNYCARIQLFNSIQLFNCFNSIQFNYCQFNCQLPIQLSILSINSIQEFNYCPELTGHVFIVLCLSSCHCFNRVSERGQQSGDSVRRELSSRVEKAALATLTALPHGDKEVRHTNCPCREGSCDSRDCLHAF